MTEFSDLKGHTLVSIGIKDEVIIYTTETDVFIQKHCQDCSETVYIESVVGDVSDLIGHPLLVAEEVTSSEERPAHVDTVAEEVALRIAGEGAITPDESYTWSFYKLDTIKGGITIRWLGESNGYYSESVDIERIS